MGLPFGICARHAYRSPRTSKGRNRWNCFVLRILVPMSARLPSVPRWVIRISPALTRSLRYASRVATCRIRLDDRLLSDSMHAALLSQNSKVGDLALVMRNFATGMTHWMMVAHLDAPSYSPSHELMGVVVSLEIFQATGPPPANTIAHAMDFRCARVGARAFGCARGVARVGCVGCGRVCGRWCRWRYCCRLYG